MFRERDSELIKQMVSGITLSQILQKTPNVILAESLANCLI